MENWLIFRWELRKIICGNNQPLNHRHRQIRSLPLVAHRYVITCSISVKSSAIYSRGKCFFSEFFLARTHIFFLSRSHSLPYLRAWITQAQSTPFSFSSLSLVVIVDDDDQVAQIDLFTFAYIFFNDVRRGFFFLKYFIRREEKSDTDSSVMLFILFGVCLFDAHVLF